MTQQVELPDEGVILVPRQVALRGFLTTLGGGAIFLATLVTAWVWVQADIRDLQRANIESRARGDDIRNRLTVLERDRDRITRVEEQLKVMLEMLREVREELRRKP